MDNLHLLENLIKPDDVTESFARGSDNSKSHDQVPSIPLSHNAHSGVIVSLQFVMLCNFSAITSEVPCKP